MFKSEVLEEVKQMKKENEKVVKLDSWQRRLRCNKNDGIITTSIVNVELILENDSNLRKTIGYNEFSGYVYLLKDSPWLNRKAGQWEDSIESALLSYIESEYRASFNENKLHSAIVNVARKNVFNPVKQRIESQQWDGKERVETFFIDLLGADDNVYTREVTKRWIVGSVTRVYNAGVKFEIVPILSGRQGIGKSTAPSKLYTDDYFSDSLEGLGESKDDYLQLRNNVILELGELSSLKKSDINKTKNFISARFDDIRLPYERNTVKWARKCVFIGTTNDSEYLRDLSGNRRFFPIPCKNEPKLDVFKLEDDYFLQVLAEAKKMLDNKQRIYFDYGVDFDKDVLKLAEQYQEQAKVEDPAEEAIKEYLEMIVPDTWDKAPLWVRRSYYREYPQSKEDKRILDKFPRYERLILLENVLTADILEVIFEREAKDTMQGKSNSDKKKISLIMGNMGEWELKRVYSRGNKRGYVNLNNQMKNNKKR